MYQTGNARKFGVIVFLIFDATKNASANSDMEAQHNIKPFVTRNTVIDDHVRHAGVVLQSLHSARIEEQSHDPLAKRIDRAHADTENTGADSDERAVGLVLVWCPRRVGRAPRGIWYGWWRCRIEHFLSTKSCHRRKQDQCRSEDMTYVAH